MSPRLTTGTDSLFRIRQRLDSRCAPPHRRLPGPALPARRTSLRTTVRRTLLTIFGLQLLLAVALTLVDSYRRRGKKPRPFETTDPGDVTIGEGVVTSYTFGQDLYEDMLEAIGKARHQVLFETYMWKGDEVGERFKQALYDAAARGVDVCAIYD